MEIALFSSARSRSPADNPVSPRGAVSCPGVDGRVGGARSDADDNKFGQKSRALFLRNSPLSPRWGRRWFGTLLLLLAFSAAAATARAGELTIRQIGAWGGSVDAVFVEQQGDRRIAYIGSGVRMVILDVTDPGNLIELSSVMFDGVIMDLEVRDGYAYLGVVPAWNHPSPNPATWFCVVDVHDVTAPFLVASGIGKGGVGGLFLQISINDNGRVAYATPHQSVAQAVDITDPTAPRHMGECGGGAVPVFSGGLQYWLDPNGGRLGTIDMSALPEACASEWGGRLSIPEFRGASAGLVGSVLVGDYLYVTAHFPFDRHSSIFVVDFSDLAAPVHVSTWTDENDTTDPAGDSLRFGEAVAVSNGRLYWAGSGRFDPLSRTLVILDIATDPTTPTLMGEYRSDAAFSEIVVLGTTAYLGGTRQGLTIVDCSNPVSPARVGNYFSPSAFSQGSLDDGKLYVTDFAHGMSILDVSDPRTPSLAGKWETGTYTANRLRMNNWGIDVRDGLAYVAAGYAGLQVVDVSNPAALKLAGEFSEGLGGNRLVGLTLSPDGLIAHVGIPGSIANYDVSDVSNIVERGSIGIGGGDARPYSIAMRPNGIAYVARDDLLVTLDLSDAANPIWLGQMSSARDVSCDGDYLYAVNDISTLPGVTGFDVLSVADTDPLPDPVGHYGIDEKTGNPVWGYAVAAQNQRAYVGMHPLDLQILDVSTPATPVLLGRATSAGAQILDLIVAGPYVYALTRNWEGGSAGVLVYRVFSPGDSDEDGDVDLRDYAALQRCFTGPGGSADAACMILDDDGDGDVDDFDVAEFVLRMTEPK